MTRSTPLVVLGWTHLVGGLFGAAGLIFPEPPVGARATAWPGYWYMVGLSLALLSVASGFALIRKRPAARRLATVVEGLQIIGFHTGDFGFLYHSGVQVLLLVSATGVSVTANFESSFGIGRAMLVREPFLMVDLVSPFALWLLWRHRAAVAAATVSAAAG